MTPEALTDLPSSRAHGNQLFEATLRKDSEQLGAQPAFIQHGEHKRPFFSVGSCQMQLKLRRLAWKGYFSYERTGEEAVKNVLRIEFMSRCSNKKVLFYKFYVTQELV